MATRFNITKYSQASAVSDYYSDFKTNLDIHPATGDAIRVKNETAVLQSLRNLLLTDYYERPFQPLIGSRIRECLFEDLSPMTAMRIETAIRDTIHNYEPRVQLYDVVIIPGYEENGYEVRLKVSLINTTAPIEVNLFLSRIL